MYSLVQFWFVKKIYILCPFIIVLLPLINYHDNELSYQIQYTYLFTHLICYRSILFGFFIYFEKKTHLHLFGCKNVTMKSWWNVTAKYVSNTIMDIAENIFFDFELLHFFQNAQRSFKRFESYFLKQNQSSILLLDSSMASNSLICRWGIHSN